MTRKRKILLGCLGIPLALLLVFCGTSLINFLQGPRSALGDRTLSILSEATTVETFRLNDTGDGDWLGSEEIRQFPLVRKGKTQNRRFAMKLDRYLRDGRTYFGPNDTTCLINPGVAFRAWRGQECVEVIVCFHCGQMIVTSKDAHGHKIHSAYTEFGLMRKEFLGLAQEAFPDDQEIQHLT